MKELTFSEIEEVISRNPVLEDPDDIRDFHYDEIMGASEVPDSFMLDFPKTIKVQGRRGTCIGFAATGISEFFNSKEYKNVSLDLSEEYAFARIKGIDIEDYGYYGYGSYLRSGAKMLDKYGTCLESLAPYKDTSNEQEWKSFVFSNLLDLDASKYKMEAYLRVSKEKEAIKRAIFQTGSPLLIGITLYESYRQAKTNGGILPVPKSGEKIIGGHGLEAVGYSEKYIICKNWWGRWGNNDGLLYIPWEAMGMVYRSIWSFVDLKENPHVSEEKMIEFNKRFLKDYQIESWEKAIKKGGLITSGSKADQVMTKGDYFVFLDRQGELD